MFTKAFLCAMVLIVALENLTHLAAQDLSVPTVNAMLGPCSVDFTVMDRIRKPIHGAIVHGEFRHGRWGLRRMELVLYTNSSGRARVEGLPRKPRSPPVSFTITYRDAVKTWNWTGVSCHEEVTMILDAP